MDIGSLNRRVTIKAPSSVRDAAGQPIPTWTDVASVWADVRFLAGLEVIRAGTEVAESRASIRIRWREGLDTGMRVYLGSMVMEITAVLPDFAGRRYVDLTATTVQQP